MSSRMARTRRIVTVVVLSVPDLTALR